MLEEYIKGIEPLDENIMRKAQEKLDNLTKPVGSLGKLEEIAVFICGIKRTLNPKIERKVIFTLAGRSRYCRRRSECISTGSYKTDGL
jgi:NaMN:DMB phosphoribosyltransferase